MMRSAEHRVVTNAEKARTTAGLFIKPSKDCTIEPAKALLNGNTPLHKPFRYSEFLKTYTAYRADLDQALAPYKIK